MTDIFGYAAENALIIIFIVMLVYCCLGVYFLPDSRSCFNALGLKSGDDDEHEDIAWQACGPAGSSLLTGSGKLQSGESAYCEGSQGFKTAETESIQPSSSSSSQALPTTAPQQQSWPESPLQPQQQPKQQGAASPVGSHSWLCPTLMLQSSPSLLLPVDIFDKQHCGPFEIISSANEPSSSPHFSLSFCDTQGHHIEKLVLFDHKSGTSCEKWLYGSSRRGGPALSEGCGYYVLDNKYAQSDSRGLSYRRSKDLEEKIDSQTDGALWGSIVLGCDEGDGWLKVGHKYLPMIINGMPVILPTPSNAAEDDSQSIFIDDDGAQPYARIKALSRKIGKYTMEQRGLEVMTLKTDSPEFHVEVLVGTERLGGISHHKQEVLGRDYVELSVKPGVDLMLVLMCSLAVVRELMVRL